MIKKIIRDDIQFLRGLSVLLIFFFHFNQNIFKYFYIGVDIFFVISGYVITSTIFSNIEFRNDFDFFEYLLKRIKRIFPNLLFFLIGFNLLFFLFIEINDGIFFEIIISTITTIFGISNFYYILNPNLEYFADANKWLQHTWSLSVELQFYLFYGLLISFIFSCKKFFEIKKVTICILLIFFIISFYFFLFGTGKYLSSYYFSLSRFWEFFLGALIYLANFNKLKDFTKINFIYFVYFFSILLIVINFLPFNLDYKLVIVGALLLVSYCMAFNSYTKLFLVNDFFKFYGNISYSFFLWHMPIISLTKLIISTDVIIFFVSILSTTLISYSSYRIIELPLNKRTKYDLLFKNSIKCLTLVIIVLSVIILSNYKLIYDIRDGLYKNLIKIYPKHSIKNANLEDDNLNDIWVLQYDNCDNKKENFSWYTGINCIIENDNESLFYILGNSYGDHLVPTVVGMANESSIYKARFENCYLDLDKNCNNNLNKILNKYKQIAKNYKKNYLFLSLNTENISHEGLSKIIDFLPTNTMVIYIYPHPTTEIFSNNQNLINYKLKKKKNFLIFKKINKNFNFFTFDTYEYLCPNDQCNLKTYNEYFMDGGHFRLSTSKYLSPIMKNFFNAVP